jgi:type VI secretion system ImpJ/VasE family protein
MPTGQIHWHEGLFLQPHHLQGMQRYLLEQTVQERRFAWPYPYGLVESKLSPDALSNMLVQFDRLRVVMPSGAVIDVPETTDLPPLDIKAAFQSSSASFTVNLAVPVWYSSRGNTLEPEQNQRQTKRLYGTVEVERPDENTGENAQPVVLRRINARLVLDGEDTTDLEMIPLLRVAHSTGADAGLPRYDPAFVPPCLLIQGSNTLYEALRDLANHVEARRGQLLARIAREKLRIDSLRGQQFAQLMKLRTLNHYSPVLAHLVKARSVTPFEVYVELRGLLGELAALRLDKDYAKVSDYDHDHPAIPFGELITRIRFLLPREGEATVITVPFKLVDRLLIADLEEMHVKKPVEYYLGIKSRQEPGKMSQLVQDADRFKLMAKSLARANIWGLKVSETAEPPLQLPKPPGMNYFRLMLSENPSSARMWEIVQQEKAMSIRYPEMEQSDYDVSLYMIVPGTEN